MSLPVLGLAGGLHELEQVKDWIFDKDRNLEIQDFVPSKMLDPINQDRVSAYKSFLDGHKGHVGLHGPFLSLDIAAVDHGIAEVTRTRILQSLDVCEQLGGSHLVIHSPFNAWLSKNFLNYNDMKPTMFAAAHDILEPCIKRGEDIGCTLVLENIDDTDPMIRRELVESFDSDHFKVSIDTGHAQLAHCNNNAPAPLDYFLAADKLLGHVHLQDVDGYADRHWHPLEGNICWGPIFTHLANLDADPRLILEPDDRYPLLPSCVQRLEALGYAQ